MGLEPPTGGWRELAVGLRRHLRRIGQSLCLASGLLAGAELLARAAEPGPFSLWDKNPYQAGDKIRYRHRPGFTGRFDGTWYSINSRGLRGPELPPRGSTGGRVVVALGDSCTFGKGVLERESWPRRLEARVGQRGNNGSVTVANLGINGLSSRDYPRWYAEAGRPLEPEIVVLGFNINDFPNALAAAASYVYATNAADTDFVWNSGTIAGNTTVQTVSRPHVMKEKEKIKIKAGTANYLHSVASLLEITITEV